MAHEIKQEFRSIYIGKSFSDELKLHTAVNCAVLSVKQRIIVLTSVNEKEVNV